VRFLALLALLAGCGGYIGTGMPPKVAVAQPMSVQIKVAGDQRDTVERALGWVIQAGSPIKRVSEGGDRQLTLTGTLIQEKYVLGTDAAFTLRVSQVEGDPGESKRFTKVSINGNLHNEVEKLVTEAVVWALERAAERPAARPVEPAPVVAPEPTPAPTPAPPPTEEPVRKKPRRRL
jgi:hypothetical protein